MRKPVMESTQPGWLVIRAESNGLGALLALYLIL
jgi:hypothetical protein